MEKVTAVVLTLGEVQFVRVYNYPVELNENDLRDRIIAQITSEYEDNVFDFEGGTDVLHLDHDRIDEYDLD